MTERQQHRLQVCENNWVRKIARVARADRSAEELDRETGEEQTTVGRTRRKDGGWQTIPKRAAELREEGRMRRGRSKGEMGGLCWERWEEGRREGILEEDGKRQGRVEKTIRWGGEEVADSTLPLINGKEKERAREIDPKHDTPNHLLYYPLTCLNNTERKIVLIATGLGLRTLMMELWKPVLVPRPEAMPQWQCVAYVGHTVRKIQSSPCYYSCVMLITWCW